MYGTLFETILWKFLAKTVCKLTALGAWLSGQLSYPDDAPGGVDHALIGFAFADAWVDTVNARLAFCRPERRPVTKLLAEVSELHRRVMMSWSPSRSSQAWQCMSVPTSARQTSQWNVILRSV